MNRHMAMAVVVSCLAIASSGCDVLGLQRFSDSIDGVRRQIDVNTQPGGRLDQLLGKLHDDVSDLIKQAEAAGGRLDDKFVADFIKVREQTFLEIADRQKKVFKNVDDAIQSGQSSALTVTRELGSMLNQLPPEVLPQLYSLAALLPSSTVSRRYRNTSRLAL